MLGFNFVYLSFQINHQSELPRNVKTLSLFNQLPLLTNNDQYQKTLTTVTQ